MANQSTYPGALDGTPTDKVSGDAVPSTDWNTYFDAIDQLEQYTGVSGTVVASSLTYVQDTLTKSISGNRTDAIRLLSGGSATNVDLSLYFASDAYIQWQEANNYFFIPKSLRIDAGESLRLSNPTTESHIYVQNVGASAQRALQIKNTAGSGYESFHIDASSYIKIGPRLYFNAANGTQTNADAYIYFASDGYIKWDEGNDLFSLPKRLSISTSSTQALSITNPADYTKMEIHAYHNDGWRGAMFTGYKARGTYAAPSAVADGDTPFAFEAWGYDGANYQRNAKILGGVGGTVSGGVVPGKWLFYTTSAAGVEGSRMCILAGGSIGMSNVLKMNMPAGTQTDADSYIYFASDAYFYWAEASDYLVLSKGTIKVQRPNTYTIFNIFDGGAAPAPDAYCDISPVGSGAGSHSYIRLFRSTNTSGTVGISITKGDGSAAVQHWFSAKTGSYVQAEAGNFGIGHTNPVHMLDVKGNIAMLGNVANADRYIYFASDATLFWDESEDHLVLSKPYVLPVLAGVYAGVINGSIWMEADGLHIYYNGAEKVVAGV